MDPTPAMARPEASGSRNKAPKQISACPSSAAPAYFWPEGVGCGTILGAACGHMREMRARVDACGGLNGAFGQCRHAQSLLPPAHVHVTAWPDWIFRPAGGTSQDDEEAAPGSAAATLAPSPLSSELEASAGSESFESVESVRTEEAAGAAAAARLAAAHGMAADEVVPSAAIALVDIDMPAAHAAAADEVAADVAVAN